MYRCGHCPSLHFFSHQARQCSNTNVEVEQQFLEELIDQTRRGPLSWTFKYAARRAQPVTRAEKELKERLRDAIGSDSFLVEWWLDEQDYRVDVLVPDARLVIEVDGPSHRGREGRDLVRTIRIRNAGYTVARTTNDDVMEHGQDIANRIASWVRSSLSRVTNEAA